eukprot:TRINITY_DN1243_c0_g1_i1.p1 TRINITY_DN1243_c0_g1~~TRINITY_DN1243_c0_g1_i1.p1  ORF type:complete len:423 (+),score=78.11 TRINITY_DN1243_c0_g1_i1:111-1271(+)
MSAGIAEAPYQSATASHVDYGYQEVTGNEAPSGASCGGYPHGGQGVHCDTYVPAVMIGSFYPAPPPTTVAYVPHPYQRPVQPLQPVPECAPRATTAGWCEHNYEPAYSQQQVATEPYYPTSVHSTVSPGAHSTEGSVTCSSGVGSCSHTPETLGPAPPPVHDEVLPATSLATPVSNKASPPEVTAQELQLPAAADPHMITVQFKWGRLGEFTGDTFYAPGTAVLVEADRGFDLGLVVHSFRQCEELPEHKVLREALPKELVRWQRQIVAQEGVAKERAQNVLNEAGVSMVIVHAEFQYDKRKITLHYQSNEKRPDFRPALDGLYAVFRCRVWFTRYGKAGKERDFLNRDAADKESDNCNREYKKANSKRRFPRPSHCAPPQCADGE